MQVPIEAVDPGGRRRPLITGPGWFVLGFGVGLVVANITAEFILQVIP
jgi:hypothetical protein